MSRGERVFGWLLAVTAGVGAVWYYSWLWLPHAYLELPLALLALILIGTVCFIRWRDRRIGLVRRAKSLEDEMWRSTLPSSGTETARQHRDPPSNER